MVHSQSTHLVSKLRARLLDSSSRIDAARACLLASRNFPRPLDARTAAAGEAALALQAESWIVLRDAETIDDWVCEELGGQDRERDLDESRARAYRKVERGLKALVRSKVIRSAKRVSLSALPHAFLSAAPLIDGRWIDVSVLELVELGVILTDSGYSLRRSRDWHSLAWEEFARTYAQGELSPVGDAS